MRSQCSDTDRIEQASLGAVERSELIDFRVSPWKKKKSRVRVLGIMRSEVGRNRDKIGESESERERKEPKRRQSDYI